MEKIILEVSNLEKKFGGLVALKSVSFKLPEGKLFSLIGPNGAGKTTVFNCITGVYEPSQGGIFFGAKRENLAGIRPYRITKKGIARTFQNIRLFANMTVLENVMVGCHARTRTGWIGALVRHQGVIREESRIKEKAEDLLDFLSLSEVTNELACNISYGHQRKLEIARALATEPSLLLLDEPVAGMNPKEILDLRKIIEKIKARGVTFLLIEHHMKVVMDISDHIVVLDHGEKIAEGTPSAIQKNKRVIEAYLGS